MKNRLTAITLAIILFAAVLMSLSCKDASQNNIANNTTANNTAMNANQSNSDQNSDSDSTLGEDCNGTNEDKIGKVGKKMLKNIRGNKFLSPQYREDGSGNFNFKVMDVNGEVLLYIWGLVYTKPEEAVNDLNKTFKNFVKKGCVKKIVFEPPPIKGKTAAAGFEFELCEYPKVVCSTGICGNEPCKKDTDATTDTNTNLNSNEAN